MIADLRATRAITQATLAELASISRPTLANIEAGRIRPSGPVLARLCAALGLTDAEAAALLRSLAA